MYFSKRNWKLGRNYSPLKLSWFLYEGKIEITQYYSNISLQCNFFVLKPCMHICKQKSFFSTNLNALVNLVLNSSSKKYLLNRSFLWSFFCCLAFFDSACDELSLLFLDELILFLENVGEECNLCQAFQNVKGLVTQSGCVASLVK